MQFLALKLSESQKINQNQMNYLYNIYFIIICLYIFFIYLITFDLNLNIFGNDSEIIFSEIDGIIGRLGFGRLKNWGLILYFVLLGIYFTGFGVSNWGAKSFSIENEIVFSAMGDIIGRLGVGGLKI